MMSSKSQKDGEVEHSGVSGETEETKFDMGHEIQGLISTMEGDSDAELRSSRYSSSMRVDEVSEQDIHLTSRLVDNEDQLLAEANFRAAAERKSYCFSKKCIWHFVLLTLFVALVVVGALLVYNSNSAQNSNSAAVESSIPPAPSNLLDICSISAIVDSGGNADDCKAACAPAQCCYGQDSTTIPLCYSSFPELCAPYMVCLSLESALAPLSNDTTILPPIPMEVAPPMTMEVAPPLPMETAPPVSASVKNVGIVSPPPDNLSYLCDMSNIQSGLSNLDSCRAGCAPSSCCFTTDHSQNCLSFKNNKVQCAKYKKYCLILTPTAAPSTQPSMTPSKKPSTSSKPSSKPSQTPSAYPSNRPSFKPSTYPSNRPSFKPSTKPVTLAPATLVPVSLPPTTLVPVVVNSTEAPVGSDTVLSTGAPVGNDTLAPTTLVPVSLPPTTLVPVVVNNTEAPVGNDTVPSTGAPVGNDPVLITGPPGNDTVPSTDAPAGTAAPVGR